MSIATLSDVAISLGREITKTAEAQQIQWWLTGVELFIGARLGDVADLDQAALLYVEAEAVAAKIRKAGSTESSITVAVDDGSVTRRWDNPVGAVDITTEWWELLTPNSVESRAFTIHPACVPRARVDWPET